MDAEDQAGLIEVARRLRAAADDPEAQETIIRRYLTVTKRFRTEHARLKYFEHICDRANDPDFVATCERAGILPKLRMMTMDGATAPATRPVRFRMI